MPENHLSLHMLWRYAFMICSLYSCIHARALLENTNDEPVDGLDPQTDTNVTVSTNIEYNTTQLGEGVSLRYEWTTTNLNETALHVNTAWCVGGFTLYKPGKNLRNGVCNHEDFSSMTYSFEGQEKNTPPRSLRREFLVFAMAEAYRQIVRTNRFKQVKVKIYGSEGLVGWVNFGGASAMTVSQGDSSGSSYGSSDFVDESDDVFGGGLQAENGLGPGQTNRTGGGLPDVHPVCTFQQQERLPLKSIADLAVAYGKSILETGQSTFELVVSESDFRPDVKPRTPEENVWFFVGYKATKKRTVAPFLLASSFITAWMRLIPDMVLQSNLKLFDCIIKDGDTPVGDMWMKRYEQIASS